MWKETDICLRTHFDNKLTPRLSQKSRRPRARMLFRLKIGIILNDIQKK